MKLKKVFILTLIVSLFTAGTAVFANGTQEKAAAPAAAKAKVQQVVLDNKTPSGNLEIFSWWAGDEAPALKALIGDFNKNYPDVKVINATVTGGSGVNAKAVLKTRMLGGSPPDSFQVHAGQELIGTWVIANRMVDLTPLFKVEGWLKVFPKDLLNLIGTKDGIWSVPVNIHRSNVLWYVPDNLKKWGDAAPKTLDEFFATADKLKAMGITPLSLGQNWTANQLWENVALSVLGADDYDALWRGNLSWSDPKVVKVWQTMSRILKYTNNDAASLSWQQATDMVVHGQAAFNLMGDWASGYMSTTLKLKPKKDYGWEPFPGTSGTFIFLSDSFGLPVGAKNPDATVAWLKTCGSKEGSDIFNPLKGSISPRTDTDMSLYNVYSQSAAKDWAKDRIVGSLTHGVVANEGFMNDFSSVMEMFLNNHNAQQAANACQAIAIQNGIGK